MEPWPHSASAAPIARRRHFESSATICGSKRSKRLAVIYLDKDGWSATHCSSRAGMRRRVAMQRHI
jgi:hypothetical protein